MGELGGELAGNRDFRATAEPLRVYIDTDIAGGRNGDSPPRQFLATMGRLLADRIDNDGQGLPAQDYFRVAQTLKNDCLVGVDSSTGEPLPPGILGKDPSLYEAFSEFGAVHLARRTYGPAFGGEVQMAFEASLHSTP